MLLGTTSRMLESDEPEMVQEWMTSHSAMSWLRRSTFFSGTVAGTGSPQTEAMTFQKRFCG